MYGIFLPIAHKEMRVSRIAVNCRLEHQCRIDRIFTPQIQEKVISNCIDTLKCTVYLFALPPVQNMFASSLLNAFSSSLDVIYSSWELSHDHWRSTCISLASPWVFSCKLHQETLHSLWHIGHGLNIFFQMPLVCFDSELGFEPNLSKARVICSVIILFLPN